MKKSKQEIAQSLHGSWRQELLFELKAALDFYKLYQKALLECDQVIERALLRCAPVEPLSKRAEEASKANGTATFDWTLG